MTITINAPCIITSRLLPGIRIGDTEISIEYSDRAGDGHCCRYRYYIDLVGAEYRADDIQSGCNHSLQDGLSSLLSFLGAAAESYAYDLRNGGDGMGGENSELFPQAIVEWANQYSDDIALAQCELEEGEDIIVE